MRKLKEWQIGLIVLGIVILLIVVFILLGVVFTGSCSLSIRDGFNAGAQETFLDNIAETGFVIEEDLAGLPASVQGHLL